MATCTFLHTVRSVSLHEFDDPSNLLRRPKRFLQTALQDLAILNNLHQFNILHTFWGSSFGTASISSLYPRLRRFSLHHATFPSLLDFAQSLSLLPLLEELSVHAEFARGVTPPDEMSRILPLPATVRRFTFKPRTPKQNQSDVYDWLVHSAPGNLEYLWVNPAGSDLPALGRVLLRCRETLKVLYFRPQLKVDDTKSRILTQEEIIAYGKEASGKFPHVHLTSLTSCTFSFTLPLWKTRVSGETHPLRAMRDLLDRLVGPSTESVLEEFHIRTPAPVCHTGMEFIDERFASSPLDGPADTYTTFPFLRSITFHISGISPEFLATVRRVKEEMWPRIAKRGLLHFRVVDQEAEYL